MGLKSKFTIESDLSADIDIEEFDGRISIKQGGDTIHLRLEDVSDFFDAIESVSSEINARKELSKEPA